MSTPYSAQSPLLGQGQATAEQIAAWFTKHTPDSPAAAIGAAIVDAAARSGVNGDLIAAQVAHETGWWDSVIARTKRNPAGLGAENDDPQGKAITFPSVAAGIRAQVAHLLTYAEGVDNPWKTLDPRYQAAADAGYLGVAHVLSDLDGRWAVPGQGYGAAIARAANDLVSFASTTEQEGGGAMPDLWPTAAELGVPYSTEKADADIGPARAISAVRWFVVHTTEGHRAGDLQILEHADPAQASVHFWISLAGEVIGIVPISFTAWTVANQAVDKQAINVELEGFAANGATEPQYVSLAAVFRWCARRGMTVPAEYVAKDERPGIIGHQDVASPNGDGWGGASHHTDPGPRFRWDHLVELINGAPAVATPSTERIINGHTLTGGFRAFYEDLETRLGANDALMLIGYPLTDELQEEGVTVQYFERAVFEWHPGSRPASFDVLLRLLGAMALAAREES